MDKLDISSSFSNFDGFRSRTSALGMVKTCDDFDIQGMEKEEAEVKVE